MANWIEGTLKLRGRDEDLLRFFNEGLEPSEGSPFDTLAEEKDGFYTVTVSFEPHIIGTHRAFIGDCWECWGDGKHVAAVPIRQAWGFFAEEWIEISKRYHLDVRLYGFERGMEFSQEVEVINGVVTKDEEKKYDDWTWECPMPRLGG